MKLILVKADWRWLLFCKKTFFYVTSGLADMTSFQILCGYLSYFCFGLSHNLFRVVCVVLWLRSYKISCELEGHLDLGVNGTFNVYSLIIVWFTSWRRHVRKLQCADRSSTTVSFVPCPVPSCYRPGDERDNKRRVKWHSVNFIRSAGRSGLCRWFGSTVTQPWTDAGENNCPSNNSFEDRLQDKHRDDKGDEDQHYQNEAN